MHAIKSLDLQEISRLDVSFLSYLFPVPKLRKFEIVGAINTFETASTLNIFKLEWFKILQLKIFTLRMVELKPQLLHFAPYGTFFEVNISLHLDDLVERNLVTTQSGDHTIPIYNNQKQNLNFLVRSTTNTCKGRKRSLFSRLLALRQLKSSLTNIKNGGSSPDIFHTRWTIAACDLCFRLFSK